MAQVILILLCCTIILSACGQQNMGHAINRLEERQRLSDLINLSSLLQSAARLAYPITTSINNVVSNLAGPNRYLPPYSSYERYPVYAPGPRGKINQNNARRNNLRPAFKNPRTMNDQDSNRRHSYKTTFYDYEYDYDYDYDSEYFKPRDTGEVDNDYIFHNPHYKSTPESSRTAYPINTNANLEPRAPLVNPSLGITDVVNSNIPKPTPVTEVPKHIHIPKLPNLDKKGNYAKPITNLNEQLPNYLAKDGGEILPGNTLNVLNQPAGINLPLPNNGDISGTAIPASNGAQPNIIYVVLKPDGIDPEIDPIQLINNQGLKPIGDGTDNKDNRYYIVSSNSRSSGLNVNNAVGVIPANSIPAVVTPEDKPADNKAELN